jgi:hypothetical protein
MECEFLALAQNSHSKLFCCWLIYDNFSVSWGVSIEEQKQQRMIVVRSCSLLTLFTAFVNPSVLISNFLIEDLEQLLGVIELKV